MDLINPAPSDTVSASTPVIEMGGAAVANVRAFNPYCGNYLPLLPRCGRGSLSPAIAGGPGAIVGAASSHKQDGYSATGTTIWPHNSGVGLLGNGYFFSQMAQPAASRSSLVQSSGGNIANGPHLYSIVAVDALGNPTTPSPQVLITTTGANQTVTLTPPTLPIGAVGYRVYRNDSSNGGQTESWMFAGN